MPELPEVETIRRHLDELVQGRVITGVQVLEPAVVGYPGGAYPLQSMVDRSIQGLHRRGKYLLWDLAPGSAILHLRMTGQVYLAEDGEEPGKHTHLVLRLDDGSQLHYRDVRKFGRWYWFEATPWQQLGAQPKAPAGLRNLGPEPLEPAFNPDYLHQQLEGRRAMIKPALLDQRLVAGLGNIYVDEILFRAGIHPETMAGDLGRAGAARLHEATLHVLRQALDSRGTSFSDYLDGLRQRGEFGSQLNVYSREGQPCPRCGRAIEKITTGGRGTHFCRWCQVPGGWPR